MDLPEIFNINGVDYKRVVPIEEKPEKKKPPCPVCDGKAGTYGGICDFCNGTGVRPYDWPLKMGDTAWLVYFHDVTRLDVVPILQTNESTRIVYPTKAVAQEAADAANAAIWEVRKKYKLDEEKEGK